MELTGQNVYVFDIEANDLYPYQDKVWTIYIERLGGDNLLINPHEFEGDIKQTILDFIFRQPNPIIVAHNGLGYDQWVLWKEYGMEFSCGPDTFCGQPCVFFDTLYASQYLLPDRFGGHSLASWGERVGSPKMDFRGECIKNGVIEKGALKGAEFKQWTPIMNPYCIQDVITTTKTFLELWAQLMEEGSYNAFKLGQKNFYMMAAQGFTGVKFDLELAMELQDRIVNAMNEIKAKVEPGLPQRPLKKSEEAYYKIPARIYKKSPNKSKRVFTKKGDITAAGQKWHDFLDEQELPYDFEGEIILLADKFIEWLEKHNAQVVGDKLLAYGHEFPLEPNFVLPVSLPMSIDDQQHLKTYFLSIGWEPTMWNIKRDSAGKPMRDEHRKLIHTTPKIQDTGVICPNLLALDGELPKHIVKYLSYKNRLGNLRGWIKNPRLEFDGRLTGGSSGIAATHRQRHHTVVNVPKAQDGVLLGKEFRSLFIVDEGNKMIGCDQAALEARVQGHWTYKYDDGETARKLLEGDCHSVAAKAFYPEETKDFDINAEDFDNSHKGFKPYRSRSKNVTYAIMYGAAAGKVATTLGKPESQGKKLLEIFWGVNQGLKDLKDAVEHFWENGGNKKWIPGIDGRRLHSRSKHSLINLLFQSTGAIVVDYALALFDMYLGGLKLDVKGRPYYLYKGEIVKRVLYVHDEFQVECSKKVVPEIAKLMEDCMEEAGVRLNLSISLEGGAEIGNNWCETH